MLILYAITYFSISNFVLFFRYPGQRCIQVFAGRINLVHVHLLGIYLEAFSPNPHSLSQTYAFSRPLSLSLSLSVSISPFVSISVCLSLCLYLCLSISLSVFLYLCLSVYLSLSLSLSDSLSPCLYLCLALSLSVSFSVSLLVVGEGGGLGPLFPPGTPILPNPCFSRLPP